MTPEPLVHVFYDDFTYDLVQDSDWEDRRQSFFGGPIPYRYDFSGVSVGPRPLHHIATLVTEELRIGELRGTVPLFYGMCFSGFDIRYEFDWGKITVLQADPVESSEDWPYPNYPFQLPYLPLVVEDSTPSSWENFARDHINQPEEQPADMIVVVPTPRSIGMSLWGPDGDAEEVEIAFHCDLIKGIVYSINRV